MRAGRFSEKSSKGVDVASIIRSFDIEGTRTQRVAREVKKTNERLIRFSGMEEDDIKVNSEPEETEPMDLPIEGEFNDQASSTMEAGVVVNEVVMVKKPR